MQLFGTDGIRGVAGEYPITPEICGRLAGAMTVFFSDTAAGKPSVVIGRDTRISGHMLELALASYLCSFGINVRLLGVIPTPAVSILTKRLKANAGVMITASHNPFQDNGIKIFNSDGTKLSDDQETELERIMMNDSVSRKIVAGADFGTVQYDIKAASIYRRILIESFEFRKSDIEDLKIVLDSANGALSSIAVDVFKMFHFNVVSINDSPNGININDHCGATNPTRLMEAVRQHQANVGIAFDGDGDRVLLVDENGNLLDGDLLLAILIRNENHPQVVSTIMANLALEQHLAAHHVELIRTNVGDRCISEEMQKRKIMLGGEPSGHIIIGSHAATGDGLFVALRVLGYFLRSRKKFSEFSNIFKPHPHVSKNVPVRDKSVLMMPQVKEEIQRLERGLQGRLVVRPSGTESLIRIYAEGGNPQQLEETVNFLHDIIRAAE
jgi:phosphoglucosamine mutase